MVKMTDRQKWRNKMVKHCIDNKIAGHDILIGLDHAERYLFQDELIVPYASHEQKLLLIEAIKTIIPDYDESCKFRQAFEPKNSDKH